MVVFLIHTHGTTLASILASDNVPKHELIQKDQPHSVCHRHTICTRKPCDTPHVCFDQRPETQ